MRGLLLRYPEPGWAPPTYARVFPGAHVLCFGKTRDALEAEDAGFEVRDAIEVVGPQRHRVWLLRKPTEEANIVGQVLKTGTGAIWIDGCRIGMASEDAQKSARQGHSERREGATSKGTLGWNADRMHAEQHPGGRWPSNLVLVHTPRCQRAGVKKIKPVGSTPTTPHRNQGLFFTGKWQPEETRAYKGEDGMETVDAWACEPDCPVAKLDEQSGEITPSFRAGNRQADSLFLGPKEGRVFRGGEGYADAGGASRFFPQFGDEAELEAWLLRLILGPTGAR